jgi:hypothetical protein
MNLYYFKTKNIKIHILFIFTIFTYFISRLQPNQTLNKNGIKRFVLFVVSGSSPMVAYMMATGDLHGR